MKHANRQVSITGRYATRQRSLQKYFANARWDVEDDLSRLIGDMPANQVVESHKKNVTSVQKIFYQCSRYMVTEFLQEEKPFIAKKIACRKI